MSANPPRLDLNDPNACIRAIGEAANLAIESEDYGELLLGLCEHLAAVSVPIVATAAVTRATEVLLQLYDVYPAAFEALDLIRTGNDKDLKAVAEALQLTSYETLLLRCHVRLQHTMIQQARTTDSRRLARACILNYLELLRAESTLEFYKDRGVVQDPESDGPLGLFPIQSFILFLYRLLVPRGAQTLSNALETEELSAPLRDVLREVFSHHDMCYFGLLGLHHLAQVSLSSESAEGIKIPQPSLNLDLFVQLLDLLVAAAEELPELPGEESCFYIDYLPRVLRRVRGQEALPVNEQLCRINRLLLLDELAYIRALYSPLVIDVETWKERKEDPIPKGTRSGASLMQSYMTLFVDKGIAGEPEVKRVGSGPLQPYHALLQRIDAAQKILVDEKESSTQKVRRSRIADLRAMEREAARYAIQGISSAIDEHVMPYTSRDTIRVLAGATFTQAGAYFLRLSVALRDSPLFAPLHIRMIRALRCTNRVAAITPPTHGVALSNTLHSFFDICTYVTKLTGEPLPPTHHLVRFRITYRVLTLDGLYTLLSTTGLTMKSFFSALYETLTPQAIATPGCRQRLLRLVDRALRGSFIQSAVLACLLKRLAHLAMAASTHATLSLVLIICRTLRDPRNVGLLWLIDSKKREGDSGAPPFGEQVGCVDWETLAGCLPAARSHCFDLRELAALQNHSLELIRRIIGELLESRLFDPGSISQRYEQEIDTILKMDEHSFVHSKLEEHASANGTTLYNSEGLVVPIRKRLVENAEEVANYAEDMHHALRNAWGTQRARQEIMAVAQARASGLVLLPGLAQKTKVDWDIVADAIVMDAWLWKASILPQRILPHSGDDE
ncbi:CBF/Mak21 family protein [Giardia muris]|uniref:CBF/Mak21 family protein n=1 Tax=Giardia muris TaxID=5742 RepID=A0A4Z1SQ93_GIAMU|nr:CBF/Mak21 family protein [Giardia muris]|eukprot:TNJ27065.1 CBF/Mak21 family protein [Giardia muris]